MAIAWEVWNCRNKVLFGDGSARVAMACVRATQLVQEYRNSNQRLQVNGTAHSMRWMPPATGMVKVNFDAAKPGEWGFGRSVVIRDHDGNLILAGLHQGLGFLDVELEEARACYFAMEEAWKACFKNITVEGNCLSIIVKLKRKTRVDSEGIRAQMEQQVRELKEVVKIELVGSSNKLKEQLELIDAIERLGVAYHFEKEIQEALLQQLHQICHDQEDLYHVSVLFRILRQHGFHVSSDVFKRFKDDEGGFKGDLKAILSLYEASHVRTHGDLILDEAAEFTTAYLKATVNELKSPVAEQVAHALHQPLHKGMIRVEARMHISFFEQEPSHNKTLLRFAKLDFNLLQSLHQKELSDLARWWKVLHSETPYTRDRSVEAYFWALGTYYEPQYSFARRILTKVVLITQLLDDTYDAYADLQNVDLLTQAINRWEYSANANLQEDIRICYQALLQAFEDIEKDLAKEGRSFCVHYAKDQMKRNSIAWLQEAKWCDQKHIPSFDEYMEVALDSIGHHVGIVGSYLGMGESATREAFEWVCLDPMPKLVKDSDIILRLMNDIGGHKFEQSSRNHVASSVECYMKQYGIKDEKQTYQELEKKVEDAWKGVNEAMLEPFEVPKPCLDRLLNLARVPNVMYKGRADGYTIVNDTIMHKVASVLVHPIPL